MTDLSRPWPFGLSGSRWWLGTGIGLAVLGLTFVFDRQILSWAKGWSPDATNWLLGVTRYGDSDWILLPSGALFLVIWTLSFLVPWKLMRLMLMEQAWLFGFIFCAVGLPSLVAATLQRIVGRGRPVTFDDFSNSALRPNLTNWDFQSFPSGQATTVFALAMAIGFLSGRWFRWVVGFAIVIGISQIATGSQHPSDILAGAALGVLGAYVVRNLLSRRDMMFRADADGSIRPRKTVAMWRYIDLKQRRSAPKRPKDQP